MLVSALLACSLTLPTLRHGQRPHQDPDHERNAERISIEARDGLKINAEFYRASADPRTPLLVLFHQARSSRAEYRPIAPRLKELGYDCLAVDLRSGQACADVPNVTARIAREHGRTPTYLDALADIEDSLAWARANHPQAKIVAWGSSYSASLVLVLAANSPKLLDGALRLKAEPRLRFAGQITGVEGYVESAAIGLLAGRFTAAEATDRAPASPPPTTALGALLAHITGGAAAATFQPMNVNFGLFPPLADTGKRSPRGADRKTALARRALADLDAWLGRRAAA